jgi:hypothetical protein
MRFCNLRLAKIKDRIELDPHVADCCVIVPAIHG